MRRGSDGSSSKHDAENAEAHDPEDRPVVIQFTRIMVCEQVFAMISSSSNEHHVDAFERKLDNRLSDRIIDIIVLHILGMIRS